MKRKEYVFKMSNLIKNRVIYHSPIEYTGSVDFERISQRGVDLSLPVFVFEKEMSKELLLSFIEAQKQVRFNLIINRCDRDAMKKIKNCFWIEGELLKQLKKLDINYKTNSKYKLEKLEEYIKIGGVDLSFEEREFFLEGSSMQNKLLIKVKKYLLSGECIQIDAINTSETECDFILEYNKNLPHGYYSFEKKKKSVKITNLMTNEEVYLNLNVKAETNFSCVDGVESSSFSRINFTIKKKFQPFEKCSFFINFGKNYFTLKNPTEMDFFFFLSQKKNYEIFDIKIQSENKFFERSFNLCLPQKIWKSWIDGTRDIKSENEYSFIRNSIAVKDKKGYLALKNDYKINAIFGYDGKSYKKIAIYQ